MSLHLNLLRYCLVPTSEFLLFYLRLDFYVAKCLIVVICIEVPWDVVMPHPIRLEQQAQIVSIHPRTNAWAAPTQREVTKKILLQTRVQIDYLTPPYRQAGTQMHAVPTLTAFLISTVVSLRHHDNAKLQNHLLKMFRLCIITSRRYLRK